MNKKTKISFVSLVAISMFVFFVKITFASSPIPITLEVPIPGMEKGIGSFGDYIILLYKYLIYLSTIVAVIMIMVAGFQWIVAGGNQSKISEARSRIVSALIGLFLVFGSYFILNTINPQLTDVVLPEISIINEVPLPSSCEKAKEWDSCKIDGFYGYCDGVNAKCNMCVNKGDKCTDQRECMVAHDGGVMGCGVEILGLSCSGGHCSGDKAVSQNINMDANSVCLLKNQWDSCMIDSKLGYCDSNKKCKPCVSMYGACSQEEECLADYGEPVLKCGDTQIGLSCENVSGFDHKVCHGKDAR